MPTPSTSHIIIGVDIAKDRFTACIFKGKEEIPATTVEEFSNTDAKHQKFLRWVKTHHPDSVLLVMEATSVYWESLAYAGHAQGWNITILNPMQIKHFRDINLKKSKTDKQDAVIIGLFAIRNPISFWTPPEPLIRDVKSQMRKRQQWVIIRTVIKNQLHAERHQAQPSQQVIRDLKYQIKRWDAMIKSLEIRTWNQVMQHPVYGPWLKRLLPVKGLGKVSLLTLLGETHGFKYFTSDKTLASYAGVAPMSNRSGTSVHHKDRISPFCNHRLRGILYLSAVSASKHNPVLHKFYRHLVDDLHKPKKVALIAVARKLLRIAFTLITQNRNYDPNYQENKYRLKTA